MGVTQSEDYFCESKTAVKASLYGALGLTILAAIVSRVMVQMGWRGGPLEEDVRWPVPHLMHMMMLILVCILGFVIYGTYVAFSPKISESCWSTNPCQTFKTIVPSSCTEDKNGTILLTPECQIAWDNREKLGACVDRWTDLASTWMVTNFKGTYGYNEYLNSSGYPLYNIPGKVSCKIQYTPNAPGLLVYDNETNGFVDIFTLATILSVSEDALFNMLPVAYQGLILLMTGLYNESNLDVPLKTGVPWYNCLSKQCTDLLENECDSWKLFSDLPDASSQRGAYLAVIFTTWFLIAFTCVLIFISFNSFPDYETEESWENSLSNFAKRFGFLQHLQGSQTLDGKEALKGLGSLLHKLFGGADLEITDMILGMYLVRRKQRWRRRNFVLKQLAKHGYSDKKVSVRNAWWTRLVAFIVFPIGVDGFYSKENVQKMKNLEELNNKEDNNVEIQLEVDDQDAQHCKMPVLTMQHSFAKVEVVQETCSSQNEITMLVQHRAFLTPLMLNLDFEPPLVSRDAARLYMNSQPKAVDKETLEFAIKILPIARSSYGLMSSKWNGALNTKWYHGCIDQCVSCLQPVIPQSTTDTYFRKRNFDTIIKMTQIHPTDLLYVSYTSTSLGLLPYLVLLHRETSQICISIRGTVGLADLVTDLLSNPMDIDRDYLPEYVLQKQGDIGSYAHAGVSSSAVAVYEDLVSNGFVDALISQRQHGDMAQNDGSLDLESQPTQMELTRLESLRDDDVVGLSVLRAQSMITEALASGWKVLLTGHSLGAAVASIISLTLYDRIPHLKCLCFNPPGGLLDENLAILTERFCTSIVVGQDAISRLSLRTTKRLIDDMMLMLARCKRPKLSVLFDALLGRYRESSSEAVVLNEFDAIGQGSHERLLKYMAESSLHQAGVDYRSMYPPGQLVFLRCFSAPDVESRNKKSNETWDAVWIDKHGTRHLVDYHGY